jgi:hypothetical protein
MEVNAGRIKSIFLQRKQQVMDQVEMVKNTNKSQTDCFFFMWARERDTK